MTNASNGELVFNVFDAMSLDDWKAQECNVPYYKRCEVVMSVIDAVTNYTAAPYNVRQVPHIMAQNEAELLEYFRKCMDEGFEGVMLKTLNTPYKFKRSKNILKLKPCVTYEGVVVGHYEGRVGTKREGQFGGFSVVLPNGIVTRVGGGFSDAQRAEFQLHGLDSYIGNVVEMEAQPDPLTTDGLTQDGRARFPVFLRFRSEADVDPMVLKAGKNFVKLSDIEQ